MTPTRLKHLLDRRDRLAKQMREVEQQLTREGRAYWQAKGLIVMPRPERLRAAVEAKLAA